MVSKIYSNVGKLQKKFTQTKKNKDKLFLNRQPIDNILTASLKKNFIINNQMELYEMQLSMKN